MEDKRTTADTLRKHTGIRTFEMIQYVSGFVEGGIDDWPANLQDALYAALERKAHEVRLPLQIVLSYCDKDIDDGRFYIRCIASEIVAVDTARTRH